MLVRAAGFAGLLRYSKRSASSSADLPLPSLVRRRGLLLFRIGDGVRGDDGRTLKECRGRWLSSSSDGAAKLGEVRSSGICEDPL